MNFLPPSEFLVVTIRWHGWIPWKIMTLLGGIPPHPRGGRRGWSFLSSFPFSKCDEELKEPLCGFPPLPPTQECPSVCLFQGTSQGQFHRRWFIMSPFFSYYLIQQCWNSLYPLLLLPNQGLEVQQWLEVKVIEVLALQGTCINPFHTFGFPIMDPQWQKVNQPMAF